MKHYNKKTLLMAIIGLVGLAGCDSPRQTHYHREISYDAPTYDAVIYTPKYTIEPSYDHTYYHMDIDARDRMH
ncbi:MAG: hypothetical protein FJX71_05175 [Alphaproteobacteria bacterium]|nr:hypothetical protein [Alphaproteobacteria bacterium]